MTAVIEVPPEVVDHPKVKEHQARRADLKARTAACAARLGELRADRERRVAGLTGDWRLSFQERAEAEAQLAGIDAQLPALERELQALTEAAERERLAGAQIRHQVELERREIARQAAVELFHRMVPHVQTLRELNETYMRLRTAAGNTGCPYSLNPLTFEQFLKQEGATR